MKRLKHKLLGMEPNTCTYHEMYDGAMTVVPPTQELPWGDNDPTYYFGEIGFDITGTHKLAQDKPTVTIMIPADKLICEKEGMPMKRLKYYLMHMENDTATYKDMYEGEVIAYPANYPQQLEYKDHYNTFYYEDISLDIAATHKLAQDKPTLTWNIPTEKLGFTDTTTVAADYCLRAFTRYIDALNTGLYNRSRPDNENGKYYLYHPGGEVLTRNTSYFALCPQKDYENGGGDTVYLLDDGAVRPPRMCLCIRMQVQLPKKKLRRTIQMLCRDLPDAVDNFSP